MTPHAGLLEIATLVKVDWRVHSADSPHLCVPHSLIQHKALLPSQGPPVLLGKGRNRGHARAKLHPHEIRAIRRFSAAGRSDAQLATQFWISVGAIRDIRKRLTWVWIP